MCNLIYIVPRGKCMSRETRALCLILTLLPISPNIVYKKGLFLVKTADIITRAAPLKPQFLVPPWWAGFRRGFLAWCIPCCSGFGSWGEGWSEENKHPSPPSAFYVTCEGAIRSSSFHILISSPILQLHTDVDFLSHLVCLDNRSLLGLLEWKADIQLPKFV